MLFPETLQKWTWAFLGSFPPADSTNRSTEATSAFFVKVTSENEGVLVSLSVPPLLEEIARPTPSCADETWIQSL